jgi:radical SAM superfamily enzyme YgiQ (UPF0313 family)
MGYAVEVYEDIQDRDAINPDSVDEEIILISILTSTAKRGYEIADRFRDRGVIIGGVHATVLPEEALKHSDQVVVGECEQILPDVVSGRIRDDIVFGGPLNNLDDIPFLDFSILKTRPEMLHIQTARGCPFDCKFCAVTRIYGKKYRFRSPANIIEELKSYRAKYGEIKKIAFAQDANFTCIKNRTKDILKMMIDERIKPELTTADARTDVVQDRELLSLLSRLNFVLGIGIESLNEEALYSPKILTTWGSHGTRQRLAFTLHHAIVKKDVREYCEHLPKH